MSLSTSVQEQVSDTQIITASCPGGLGTVDAVTAYLYQQGCYINEINSFDDIDTQRFFIRIEFRPDRQSAFNRENFISGFKTKAASFDMDWTLTRKDDKAKVVIMVSKHDHCLNDLLYRYRTGDLKIEIPAIISNHPDLEELAKWHGIPYFHLPVNKDIKPQQEAMIWKIIQDCDADLVVLARYMQVLSSEMCQRLAGWAINIHHSLLPGFKGAKPYYQAYHKGVKLVGATAHYISDDLDEGPIITQGVETVDHSHYPADLAAKGQAIECQTLSRAVRWHIEQRVFLHGEKSVVFAK
ncbi:formyltetrahydrofolate deformylase [Psychromonas ingrahamii 37]|uniref:Formyltetrahydrofolate deformylase n=1 Tax=Psychromonas ingrahamii (strain DSM 17664 / CCUG 51855 / 37) TaxID=357804 RepID=A1STQ1_PSYIN|nr:formyltetrahydrofolate deformylase [Psychromonas ingrahamii]ABM02866.1 formyltetrahydrofolate deformylase [Psychromonas ingrahamii 37]